jgi:hypothetical protein
MEQPCSDWTWHDNESGGLSDARHTRIDCVDGVAWVTIDNDLRDVVPDNAAQSFVVDRSEELIVCAIQGRRVVEVVQAAGSCRALPRRAGARPVALVRGAARGGSGVMQAQAPVRAPADLAAEPLQLRPGERFVVRPVRPQDARWPSRCSCAACRPSRACCAFTSASASFRRSSCAR